MSDERARAALAAIGRDTTAPLVPTLPALSSPRRAAVLMLFGVLDDRPSDHHASAARVSDGLDVLLLRRADTLRAHPSQVAFPGGRIDAGDLDAADAALREAHEETGLDPAGVDVLGVLPAVPLAFSNHLVEPVLAWWRSPSPVRVVDERESATVFRAPVADLLDPGHRGVTVIRRDGQEWRGPAFTLDTEHGTETVWGFTAMLLDALFDQLGWAEPWDDRTVIPLPVER
ncbi:MULTISPECIES: NUDIX domain-containing protein [Curtobacterium]|uniref:NUDIX hydrolase n=1 Tax=Curtobacterium flaccumfaciens TaxID=2035 RepID=UPI003EE4B42B